MGLSTKRKKNEEKSNNTFTHKLHNLYSINRKVGNVKSITLLYCVKIKRSEWKFSRGKKQEQNESPRLQNDTTRKKKPKSSTTTTENNIVVVARWRKLIFCSRGEIYTTLLSMFEAVTLAIWWCWSQTVVFIWLICELAIWGRDFRVKKKLNALS